MAVGRISGPLLKADLQRNGVDLAFETDLFYLDVNNKRLGVNTDSPSSELEIAGNLSSTEASTGKLTVDDIVVNDNQIQSQLGDLIISTPTEFDNIQLQGNTQINGNITGLGTAILDDLLISGSSISALSSGTNISLIAGTGANVSMSNTRITDVAIPEDLTDAVTVEYLEDFVNTSGTSTIAANIEDGEAIDTSFNSVSNTITIAAEIATDENKGVASFDSDDFVIDNGAISLNVAGLQRLISLVIVDGEGITTQFNQERNEYKIEAETATYINKGIASFRSTDFLVEDGNVAIDNVDGGFF